MRAAPAPARSHRHTPTIYSAPLPLAASHPSHSSPTSQQHNPYVQQQQQLPLPTPAAGGARAMDSRRRALLLAVAMVVCAAPARVGGDIAADRAECSDKLVALATCLTYVQDGAAAAAPTPDCCAGLKTVLQSSRKCLCVLVKDRDDPELGLKINVTKALGLPHICSAPANISDCPRLLNLPPDSKDAQVFEQFAKQEAAQGTTPSGGGSSAASASAQKNGAAAGPAMRWLGVGSRAGDGGARAVALALFAAVAPLAVPFLILLLG